jgi:hypothetical protein
VLRVTVAQELVAVPFLANLRKDLSLGHFDRLHHFIINLLIWRFNPNNFQDFSCLLSFSGFGLLLRFLRKDLLLALLSFGLSLTLSLLTLLLKPLDHIGHKLHNFIKLHSRYFEHLFGDKVCSNLTDDGAGSHLMLLWVQIVCQGLTQQEAVAHEVVVLLLHILEDFPHFELWLALI